MDKLKRSVIAWLDGRRERFTALSEDIYRYPETGLNEVRTSALLADLLESENFEVSRSVASLPTAFSALYGNGAPSIAILAEMDALPVVGHACGHNIIAAAAIGAACAIRHHLPPESLTLRVLATPAEELGVGKIELIKAGFFSGIDFAMMVHPSSRRQVIKGFLGLAKVRFTFHGAAAHAAAYPEEGINALDGVIQTFNAVNALRQQLRQDIRVHGIITEGGVAPNIIPELASCYFYVRADDLEELRKVKKRVILCAEGAAIATGCELEVDEDPRLIAPFKICKEFSALYSAQLRYLGLEESVLPADRNRGSSDIGNVSQIVPTIHPHVPIGDGVHIHTQGFAEATVSPKGQEAVLEGAKAMALTACDLVLLPSIRNAILGEFNK